MDYIISVKSGEIMSGFIAENVSAVDADAALKKGKKLLLEKSCNHMPSSSTVISVEDRNGVITSKRFDHI